MPRLTIPPPPFNRMISESNPPTIFYTSVSHSTTILADFLPPSHLSTAGDISALAAACLEASPRFHLLYTHTANRRIYAFLMSDHLLFFAIADDSLGRSAIILFLHRLRDATSHSAQRRVIAGDRLHHHCLQDELLPVIRRVLDSFFARSNSKEENPVLLSTPPSSDSHLLTGEHRRKIKKERKKGVRGGEEGLAGSLMPGIENQMSVLDHNNNNAGEGDLESGGRKSLQRVWRQQVRLILVIDVVVCTLLFGIWLSVCKGFQCVG